MKSKMNPASTKLLHKMTLSAMPMHEKPSLHLHGAHAKKFHGHAPGAKVTGHFKGTVKNVGFGYDNEPSAEIALDSVNSQGAPNENPAEDMNEQSPPKQPVGRKSVK